MRYNDTGKDGMMLMEQKELTQEEAQRFRRFTKSSYWQFAKTYAAFCPHEYTLRKWDKTGDFQWFFETVYRCGFDATYGNNIARYFVDSETGYYYFVPHADVHDGGIMNAHVTLINRPHVNEFEFVEETTLFGTEVKVKRLPPEKRKPW